jgi:DNA-binding LytR/AlgR family response regulator
MINALIIEDEKAAAELLVATLSRLYPEITVTTVLQTLEESICYFKEHTASGPDLLFCDVQLSDGTSFELFNAVEVQVPVIFVTGFDKFLLDAFEYNGIAYLLKPIDPDDLDKALRKYKLLERHFKQDADYPVRQLMNYLDVHKKKRIIGRKGAERVSLPLSEVVLFYSENKVVYAIDTNDKAFMIDISLTDLEGQLDSRRFFRASRQYILNINYVKSFRPYERVKLSVELTLNHVKHTVIVSQETAPAFKKWLQDN